MPQYEQTPTEVLASLESGGVRPSTAHLIEQAIGNTGSLVIEAFLPGTPPSPTTQLLTVGSGQSLTGTIDASIIMMSPDSGNANLIVGPSNLSPLVFAGGGDDTIIYDGGGDATIETGGGSDSITTGAGQDQVTITGEGQSTVSTGEGGDSVVITGSGSSSVDTGTGNDTITLATDLGSATISGGAGHDTLVLADLIGNHTFSRGPNGELIVNSAPTTISGVEVVQFNDSIAVIAETPADAAVARLYEVLFDRQADLGGLANWMDSIDAGSTATDIAAKFASSQEFHDKFGSDTNEEFLGKLYQGMAGREADADGLAHWLSAMDNGATQADVALSFAQSQEAVQLMGIDGTKYVIDYDSLG